MSARARPPPAIAIPPKPHCPQQFEPTAPPPPDSLSPEPPRRTANPFEAPPMTPRPSPSHSASSPSSTVDLHVERLLRSTSSSSHCLVRSSTSPLCPHTRSLDGLGPR